MTATDLRPAVRLPEPPEGLEHCPTCGGARCVRGGEDCTTCAGAGLVTLEEGAPCAG